MRLIFNRFRVLFELRPNCAQNYRKPSKKVEKYRNISKAKSPDNSIVIKTFALFSGSAILPALPTHGRSQRFKSSIAHTSSIRNAVRRTPARLNKGGGSVPSTRWPFLL